MSTFNIHPTGLSSITCTFPDAGASNYQILPTTINIHERERLKIVYAEGRFGGFVRGSRRGLVPFEFDVFVQGTTVENAMLNYNTLLEAITNPGGGTVEFKPIGYGAGVLGTFYHYLQSAPPQLVTIGAMGDIAPTIAQPEASLATESARYHVTLMTKAWATSDPDTYQTVVSAQEIDNEGDDLIVPASSIKGLALQPVLELYGDETGGDDILKNVIIYSRKMRVGANTDLDWIEGEDMEDPMGDFDHARFCGVYWRAVWAQSNYPVDVVNNTLDTATPIGLGQMQADGDDLRLFNGETEIDRWLDDINDATTKVWTYLDFEGWVPLTLSANVDPGDTTFTTNQTPSAMPSSGIVQINAEFIKYSSKDDGTKTFTVETRGYGNTVPASHIATDPVEWIQHDLWLKWGDDTLSAPVVDDDYEPAFELDLSTNISWVYEEFGEDDLFRTGQWKFVVVGTGSQYGGNRGAAANPWIEAGLSAASWGYVRFYLNNMCEITNVNFTNGEKWESGAPWVGRIESSVSGLSWNTEYNIPDPSVDSTWEAWSRNEALLAGRTYAALYLQHGTSGKLEAADCTVTLNSTLTPVVTLGVEKTISWATIADAGASGGNYVRCGAEVSNLSITDTNTANMDSTYLGKISPIVIARCDTGTSFDIRLDVYVTIRGAMWSTSKTIALDGTSYWKCLYTFGEIDFPPYPIPYNVAEADIDDFIENVFAEVVATKTGGYGNIEIDVLCMAKASEFISRFYNNVDETGLQLSSGQILVVDTVENMSYAKTSTIDLTQPWERQGVPLRNFVLPATHDHRLRVIGWKDDTLKYTQDYDYFMEVKGLYLTILPFAS